MSSPAGPQDDFNWGQVAPDALPPAEREQAERQVRLMLASGKSRAEVEAWLENSGLTPDQAEGFVETKALYSHRGSTSGRIGGIVGASIGAMLSLVATLKFQPWSAEWAVRGDGGTPVHPLVALLFWLLIMTPLVIMFWLVGKFLGQILLRQTHRGDR